MVILSAGFKQNPNTVFFLFHQVEIHNQESGIIENCCLSNLTSTFGRVFHLPSPRLAVGI